MVKEMTDITNMKAHDDGNWQSTSRGEEGSPTGMSQRVDGSISRNEIQDSEDEDEDGEFEHEHATTQAEGTSAHTGRERSSEEAGRGISKRVTRSGAKKEYDDDDQGW